MPATERVPVLMTPVEKKMVVRRAKKAGLTTGEYMRRAAEGYRPDDNNQALEAMIEQMNQATERAEKAIDNTLSFVAKSNKRIAAMETEARRGSS